MGCEKHLNIIKNTETLFKKGNIEGRKTAIRVLEYALKKVDTYKAVRRTINIKGDKLFVGKNEYDLSKLRNIYVLGAGKATFEIAKALEETFQGRIRDGVIIEKRGRGKKLVKIRVLEADHPIPSESGQEGAIEVTKIAEQAGEGDLVFVAVTGGC